MRKSYSALRTGLIISALALVLFFALLLSFMMPDELAKVKMKAFLVLNAGNLDQIGQNALNENREGTASFFFGHSFNPDISMNLLYLPDDAYMPPEDQGWQLASSAENSWRWEGGGMLRSGYINVERLKPKWFCVEKYYPT